MRVSDQMNFSKPRNSKEMPMTLESTDTAAEVTNKTYAVQVNFSVRPREDAYLQDQYAICDEVGQWLQEITCRLQGESLDLTDGNVQVGLLDASAVARLPEFGPIESATFRPISEGARDSTEQAVTRLRELRNLQAKRLTELEAENARLKRLVADQALAIEALKESRRLGQ
jgi:hypothetical protein